MKAGAVLSLVSASLWANACAPTPVPKSGIQPPAIAARPRPDPEAWRTAQPPKGSPAKLAFSEPSQFVLKNGFHVYALPCKASTLSLSTVVRHDARSIDGQVPGLAALTARMLSEGSKGYPDLALAEAIEGLGSDFSIHTGRDATTIGVEALPSDLNAALSLLAEVVTRPQFSPKAFDRVKAQWIDNVRDTLQDPRSLSSVIGFEALLGKELGSPVHGYPEGIQELKREDIQRFHARAYTPAQAGLAVVGDFDPEALEHLVEERFGKWKRTAVPKNEGRALSPALRQGIQILLLDRPGSPQSALFAAQSLPPRREPGYAERELLVTTFGGLFTSRLNLNLREKKAYTYGAFGSYVATRNWGALAISTSVETKYTADAIREILQELRDLGSPTTPRPLGKAEVDRARADIVHSLVEHLGHTNRMVADLEQLFVHELPLNYFSGLAQEIQAADLGALQHAASTLITPASLTIAVVGDRSSVEAPLHALGYPVKTLRDFASSSQSRSISSQRATGD